MHFAYRVSELEKLLIEPRGPTGVLLSLDRKLPLLRQNDHVTLKVDSGSPKAQGIVGAFSMMYKQQLTVDAWGAGEEATAKAMMALDKNGAYEARVDSNQRRSLKNDGEIRRLFVRVTDGSLVMRTIANFSIAPKAIFLVAVDSDSWFQELAKIGESSTALTSEISILGFVNFNAKQIKVDDDAVDAMVPVIDAIKPTSMVVLYGFKSWDSEVAGTLTGVFRKLKFVTYNSNFKGTAEYRKWMPHKGKATNVMENPVHNYDEEEEEFEFEEEEEEEEKPRKRYRGEVAKRPLLPVAVEDSVGGKHSFKRVTELKPEERGARVVLTLTSQNVESIFNTRDYVFGVSLDGNFNHLGVAKTQVEMVEVRGGTWNKVAYAAQSAFPTATYVRVLVDDLPYSTAMQIAAAFNKFKHVEVVARGLAKVEYEHVFEMAHRLDRVQVLDFTNFSLGEAKPTEKVEHEMYGPLVRVNGNWKEGLLGEWNSVFQVQPPNEVLDLHFMETGEEARLALYVNKQNEFERVIVNVDVYSKFVVMHTYAMPMCAEFEVRCPKFAYHKFAQLCVEVAINASKLIMVFGGKFEALAVDRTNVVAKELVFKSTDRATLTAREVHDAVTRIAGTPKVYFEGFFLQGFPDSALAGHKSRNVPQIEFVGDDVPSAWTTFQDRWNETQSDVAITRRLGSLWI